MELSTKYSLDKANVDKIIMGAIVALGGAFLTYWQQTQANIDFGTYTPLATAVNAILVNAIRKYLTDFSKKEETMPVNSRKKK